MEFKEFLMKKHLLEKGEKKIKEISINQYENRLENLKRKGIYQGENSVDDILRQKIQDEYKRIDQYVRTIELYIQSKKY